MQVQIMTDSSIDQKARQQSIDATNRMRERTGSEGPQRPFDREKFEKLRQTFGRAKPGKPKAT